MMPNRDSRGLRVVLGVIVALGLTVGLADPAAAAVSGDSSAFGESVNISIVPALGPSVVVQSGPKPVSSGSAPPAYNDPQTLASASVSQGTLGSILSTGVLTTNAQSPASPPAPTASALVNDVAAAVSFLLTLGADSVQSTASVVGPCGTPLVASGTTTIANGNVSGLIPIDPLAAIRRIGTRVAIAINPAPNTVVLDTQIGPLPTQGIRVVVNEQFLTGDGTTTRGITVNAIHVYLNIPDIFGLGAITGDIIIAQSTAELDCSDASADLVITKVASPSPSAVGQQLTYLITVTNEGPNAAPNVMVTDTLPLSADVTFVSATPSVGTCGAPNPLVCNLGLMAPGSSATVSVKVNVGAGATGPLGNTAMVVSDLPDPNTANNTAVTSTPLIGGSGNPADLSIVKVGTPNPVAPGKVLTYVVTVTNEGPNAAPNVTVTDTLPLTANVTFASATPSQGTCGAPNPLVCSLGLINSGAIATITVKVNVGPATNGPLANSATVASDALDPDTSNNTASISTSVVGSADLVLSKVGTPNPVTPGQQLTYLLTVTNEGPTATKNVTVTDTLPLSANVTFVSATPTQGTCGAPNPLVCNLGFLGAGVSATITVKVNVGLLATGPLNNSATVTSDYPDPDTASNTANTSTTVFIAPPATADLIISKVNSPNPVPAGEQLTYLISVTNEGPNTATGVTVTDTLPVSANVTFVSAVLSQGTCGAPNPMVCNLGSLANGATATITVKLNVGGAATGPLGNSATVSSSVDDPNTSNNTASTNTPVTAGADLSFSKVASPNPVTPGQQLTYLLTVTNEGPSPASTVVVTDTLPLSANVIFASATPSQGTCGAPNPLTCNLGALAAGASATITIKVNVGAAATGPLGNSATVISNVEDPDESNNTKSTSTAVTVVPPASADLALSKAATPSPVTRGEQLTYLINVTNNGPNVATNVTVTETLPLTANVTFASATPSQGACGAPNPLVCNLGSLAVGASASITVKVNVGGAATGPLGNSATVASDVNDPDTSNNTRSTSTPVIGSADLVLSKVASPNPVSAGNPLTYLITVTNEGPSPAPNVTVTETLPLSANVTFGSATPSQGTCGAPNPLVCNLGSLAAGASATLTVVVNVSIAATGPLGNTASVTSGVSDPDTSTNTVATSTAVTVAPPASADLRITKGASPNPVMPGQQLTYSITVTNNGPNAASSVTVSDTLPLNANVTFASATPSQGTCGAPNPLVCNLGSLAAGASATITVKVNVGAGAAGPLGNSATVTSNVNDPNTSNNTASTSTPVIRSADLVLTKVASPSPVTAGQQLTYLLTVINGGPSSAPSVTVTDTLPLSANVTFVSATPSQGTCGAPNPVVCNLGTLAAGASATVTIKLNVGISATGPLGNSATVTSGVSDPDTSTNTRSTSTTVASAPPASADLALTKVASPNPVTPGQQLTYLITVTNEGPSAAPNVTVTDTLPLSANVTFASATPSQGTCGAPNPLVCSLGSLASGASATITVKVNVGAAATGPLGNSATVTSDVNDPDTSNNTRSTNTTVSGGGSADLALTKVASPNPVEPGKPLIYLITVTNEGPSAAPNVSVADFLPLSADVTFVSATPSQGTCGAPNPLVCDLGLVSAGASATVTVKVNVGAGATGPLENDAMVVSDASDPDPSNNTASTSTTVGGGPAGSADLVLTKVNSPNPVAPGEELTYLLSVTNEGPDPAPNVTVTDLLPLNANVTFVSATPSQGTCGAPNPLVCNFGPLNAGASATLTVKVNVGVAATGPLGNSATVASDVDDPDTSSNTVATTTTVTGSADLVLTKVASPNPVAPGQVLTYLITATNEGPDPAANVTVTDQLPLTANVTFVSATASQGSCSAPNPVVCSLGLLNAGASATVTVKVNVGAAATGPLGNSATVASNLADPDTSTNTVSTSTAVTVTPPASADLALSKVASPNPVAPGEQLTYLITVINEGPNAAPNVTVTDTLPLSANVTFVSATPSQGTCGAPNPLVCSLGSLAAGTSAPITIKVNVGAAATGPFGNSATVASDVNDPDTSNNTRSTNTPLTGRADLALSKVASPSPVAPGQPLTYLLTVTNEGPGAAPNVTVTDALPLSANVTFGSATPSQGTCGAPNPLVCNLGSLAAGASATITVVVNVGIAATGPLGNSATVVSGVSDPDTSSNTVTTSTAVTVAPPASADLRITKGASPNPVMSGQQLTYSITVTNNGPNGATNVIVTDTLPLSANVTFASATPSQGTCGAPNPLVCNLGSLAAGASATLTVKVNVGADATGPLGNSATVTSNINDPNTSNNTASTSTPVIRSANLVLTKAGSPNPVSPGQSLTYLITVTNSGPSAAPSVTVTETLPLSANVTFASATPSQGTCGTPNPLVCNLGLLNAGVSATLTVVVNVGAAATGPIANSATVASSVSDPETLTNTASTSTTVAGGPAGSANLSLTKVGSPNPVAPGQALTYLLTVTNAGPDAAPNVVVTDTLPLSANVTFGSATPSQGTCGSPNPLVCNLGLVNAGASATITVVVNVGAAATGSVSNSATVTSSLPDPDPSNNVVSTSNTVGSAPAAIPTLSEWAVVVMTLLLAAAGYAALRRRAARLR